MTVESVVRDFPHLSREEQIKMLVEYNRVNHLGYFFLLKREVLMLKFKEGDVVVWTTPSKTSHMGQVLACFYDMNGQAMVAGQLGIDGMHFLVSQENVRHATTDDLRTYVRNNKPMLELTWEGQKMG